MRVALALSLLLAVAAAGANTAGRPLSRRLQESAGFRLISAEAKGTSTTASTSATLTTDPTGVITTGTAFAAAENTDLEGKAQATTTQLGFTAGIEESIALDRSATFAQGTRSASAASYGISSTAGGLPFASAFGAAYGESYPASYGYGKGVYGYGKHFLHKGGQQEVDWNQALAKVSFDAQAGGGRVLP